MYVVLYDGPIDPLVDHVPYKIPSNSDMYLLHFTLETYVLRSALIKEKSTEKRLFWHRTVNNRMTQKPSNDLDQLEHAPSLIKVLVVTFILIG